MSENFRRLIVQNKNVLRIIPGASRFITRYLKKVYPITIADITGSTINSCGYALQSEKISDAFIRIMRRLESYIGSESIGPNKYWEYPWALLNMQLSAGMKVLDAGCGKSPVQYLLSDLGMDVSGVDVYEDSPWHGIDRSLARKFGCSIQYRKESLDCLSFEDNTFDRACCLSVLEHCRETPVTDEKLSSLTFEDHALQRKMMQEMLRVLRPGGLLVVTVDFNIPRNGCVMESNVSINNLMAVNGAVPLGASGPKVLPGDAAFSVMDLINNADIDIVNYCNTLQTSIGLVLQKN